MAIATCLNCGTETEEFCGCEECGDVFCEDCVARCTECDEAYCFSCLEDYSYDKDSDEPFVCDQCL